MTWEYILLIKNKQNIFFSAILLSLLLGCITKGIFSIWCEKKELVYNKTCKVSDYQLGPALKKNPYIHTCVCVCVPNFTVDNFFINFFIISSGWLHMEVCFLLSGCRWNQSLNTVSELAPALLVVSSLYDIDFLFPFVAAFCRGGGGGGGDSEWLIKIYFSIERERALSQLSQMGERVGMKVKSVK